MENLAVGTVEQRDRLSIATDSEAAAEGESAIECEGEPIFPKNYDIRERVLLGN